ncbi:protein of unknown function [Trichlorobacter ammonificans]|uniref:Uncharacterized protein n=1 Tax=Trichlorobacter ammonificans TaxID=2916410 RepID=A0ABM9D615_9BACT|nr:protein of unknown function [Trichlorobacter ammonificans]
MTVSITDHNQCGEAEATATLHNLGYTAYVNHAVRKIQIV